MSWLLLPPYYGTDLPLTAKPPAQGDWSSQWYFPQAKELNTHNKYFLMGDAYERAATLGFRCVRDVVGVPAGDALPEVLSG